MTTSPYLLHCALWLLIGSVTPRLTAQVNCQEKHPGGHGLELRATGNASRSDTIDILHTRIALDLTQVGNGVIAAATTLRMTPRLAGIDHVNLDLLALTVDSVRTSGSPLVFSQTGETLTIGFGASYGPADTLEMTIHYHGDPVVDASGWGGFYTSGNILYNLGVAFESEPHSFGRAWFPCFDNFVERCSYEFLVLTDADRHAWCNGVLQGETDLGNGRFESHWLLDETIPSYLASVTASTYVVVRDTFPSINGTLVPVDLVAQSGDTVAMKNSFIHLQDAFDNHEAWFGHHRWDRVGYCLTGQGAMEHATNISYPVSITNGSLTYETTMAHELAHHWFGDQITCARAEEMYLNEGFAEYISYLFLERVYGRERYMKTVRENHHEMVYRSHLLDEGWWALADMPQEHTYGDITYNKGADVLHTLRSYLGDTLFRSGLTSFLDRYAFQPVTTEMLRDHLSDSTGVDLTDYFNDWILQPGWAAFELDSFSVAAPQNGVHPTTVHIQQKQRGPAQAYHSVPMTISFVDGAGTVWSDIVPLGEGTTTITRLPAFIPVKVLLNADERISEAVTVDVDTLDANGIYNLDLADFRLTVNSIPLPTPVRFEEYWVAADLYADAPNLYQVSPDRWWRVHMELPSGTDMTGRIRYDGRNTTAGGLDVGLMQDTNGVIFHEDSLILLHRPNAHFPWSVYPDFSVNTVGSAIDKTGRIELGHVEPGDYTLGWRYSATGVPERARRTEWSLAPNPASGQAWIIADHKPKQGARIVVYDLRGGLVNEVACTGKRTMLAVDSLASATYVVGVSSFDAPFQYVGRLQVVNAR